MDQMKDLEENMLTETAATEKETGGTTQTPLSADAESLKKFHKIF